MPDHKPLPALPNSSSLTSLTIDARAHRARLIRHFLAELPDPGIHNRHEGWAYAIEDALDDLSTCLARGDWLAGIRRRRQSRHRDTVLAHSTLQPEPRPLKDTSKSRPQSPNPSPNPLPPLAVPNPNQRQFHLLLCLAPSGTRAYLPPGDHGFDIVPANIGCAFVSSKFLLPSDPDHAETAVLFGINEWDDTPKLRIVGGTFAFKGVDTLTQHEQLAQVLRISIYIHLSLLLEQQFLSDSHVPLKFPRPKLSFPSSSAPSEKDLKTQHPSPGTNEDPKSQNPTSFPSRSPFLPHGILSFFSRKKGLSHRAQTVNQTGSRGALDLISNASALAHDSVPPRSPSTSIDGAPAGVSRLRRFSLIGGGGSGSTSTHENERGRADPELTDGPFTAALKRVKRSKSLLSTSVGVTFFPPSVLVDLAEREGKSPNRRLKGDERVALASVLGWTGKDPPGRGMAGIPGFVRQQEFSFLQSQHVPASQIHSIPPPMVLLTSVPVPVPVPVLTPTPIPTPDLNHVPTASVSTTATSVSSCPDPQSTVSALSTTGFTLCCGRPLWRTYRYFSRDSGEDQPLGEAVSELLTTADLQCAIPGCLFKVGEHERRIVHGGVQITIATTTQSTEDVNEKDKGKDRDGIVMWESCRVCEKESARVGMSDGTYLFSYAKFLEVLIYSPSISVLSPSLCEHTTPAPPPPNPHPHPNPAQSAAHEFPLSDTPPHPHIPQSKLNLIRHFSTQNATVSFSLANVENIFEFRGPRLQINGGAELERERGREKDREREREREKGKAVSSADQHRPSIQEKTVEKIAEKGQGSGVINPITDDGDPHIYRVDDAGSMEEAKKVLRREIKRWWEGIADHMDKLERLLASDEVEGFKKLPRLPSVDDAYDDFDVREVGKEDEKGEEDEEAALTPRPPAARELPAVEEPSDTPESEVTDSEAGEEEDATKTPRRSRSENLTLPDTPEDEDKTPTVSKIHQAASIVTTSAEDTSQETSASVSTSTLSSTNTETTSASTLTTSTCDDKDPRELLENLRHKFQRAEHSLYAQLARTPDNSLNDVRRSFLSTAKGAQKRLCAWQRKHLARLVKVGGLRVDEGVLKELDVKELKELISGKEGKDEGKGMARCVEPDWWAGGSHVLPGSSVVVREDDLGSIIAFTLSSPDYHRELANLAVSRTGVSTPPPLTTPPPLPTPSLSRNFSTANASSFFTSTTGKLFGFTNGAQPDPDQDDIVWYEPEPYSTIVTRKEHPRDATSILSIREVLRHREKSPALDLVTGTPLPLALSGANESLQQSGLALASVYAKPDVRVSMQAADGEVSVLSPGPGQGQGQGEKEDPAGKILHEIEAVANGEGSRPHTASSHAGTGHSRFDGTTTTDMSKRESGSMMEGVHAPRPVSPFSDRSSMGTSGYNMDMHIRRAKAESILASLGGSEGTVPRKMERAPTPPPKESKEDIRKGKEKEKFLGVGELKSGTGTPAMKDLPATPGGSAIHHLAASSSSFANTIASSLNMAMRFVLNQPESRPASAHPPPVPKKQPHHNLLLVDANNIDERPHIKYDWTIGKRLKFSCTVYYARQFDLMRKRCGIDDSYLKSLEKSVNWTAVGGKSRSNFWKTVDERFIIKTLVNAWNVADLQVLIELGPSYFRYIESTASKATVLVKLIGFYTIEIRNLETGAVQSKADLLVMENLFYNHKINKTFDLKGIQGRKVKAKQNGPGGSRTLFDNEWIEGQQRTFMLLQPHSKHVLREAIRSDADFLAKSNIMDYSLLLGIDEEEKQIACGLVDTIGSYTFAKTLEYKAKHNLHSGKDVTVIPPTEYQDRFVNALEDYFLACPDKWSKPLDETKTVSDPFLLPSVL
ncbi:hypothetical protein P691DRAFT_710328 [Macrolepiota fuliginosa MF-IS2]|uniref:PIPK domain-containing protein n=1 Tax=Macrolepiota fuliginosa MF-IS2 TaxID=1400762 RepID=A0A9P5X5Z2_9AGAR|nr:hypothetical protein P691DRAFT_710328 [Macrolepiota fuliginosa MF-IS2]